MSSIYTTTYAAIAERLADDVTVGLPIVFENDSGDDKVVSTGFLGVSVEWSNAQRVSINHPVPKVRHFGTMYLNVCTPINRGPKAGTQKADLLHTLFSGRVFSGVSCFIGYIDSKRKIKYSKGEYWCTPFICNFYTEEYLTVA